MGNRTKSTTEAEVARVLRAIRALSPDDRDRRTLLLRDLGQSIVDLREHFTTAEGQPDWPGRTGAYRASIQDSYTTAGYGIDEAHAVQKAARYHIANALRLRLSPQDIEALGMRAETPRERQAEIRERNAAIVAAYQVAPDGPAEEDSPEAKLAAILEALAILNRLRVNRKRAADPAGAEIRAAGRRALQAIADRANDLIRQTPEN